MLSGFSRYDGREYNCQCAVSQLEPSSRDTFNRSTNWIKCQTQGFNIFANVWYFSRPKIDVRCQQYFPCSVGKSVHLVDVQGRQTSFHKGPTWRVRYSTKIHSWKLKYLLLQQFYISFYSKLGLNIPYSISNAEHAISVTLYAITSIKCNDHNLLASFPRHLDPTLWSSKVWRRMGEEPFCNVVKYHPCHKICLFYRWIPIELFDQWPVHDFTSFEGSTRATSTF